MLVLLSIFSIEECRLSSFLNLSVDYGQSMLLELLHSVSRIGYCDALRIWVCSEATGVGVAATLVNN